MRTATLTILAVLSTFMGFSQESDEASFFDKHPIVNQLEIGALFGRIKVPVGYYNWYTTVPCWNCFPQPQENQEYVVQNIRDISLRFFTGISLSPTTHIGVTVGADKYESSFITPFMLGARQTVIKNKRSNNEILASIDVGYGTTWLHEDDSNFKTTGGLTFNPALIYKLHIHKSAKLLLSFGYNLQNSNHTYNNFLLDDYEYNEKRIFRRFSTRIGFEF